MYGLLLSGGVDSAVLAHRLVRKHGFSKVLGFIVEHPCGTREEVAAARKIADSLGIEYVLGNLGPLESVGEVIPGRNLLFAAWAANILQARFGGGTLAFGFCKEDRIGFRDCDSGFVQACEELLTRCGCKVEVVAPFMHMGKRQIVSLPGAADALEVAYSCYREGGPCGECSSCVLRQRSEEL